MANLAEQEAKKRILARASAMSTSTPTSPMSKQAAQSSAASLFPQRPSSVIDRVPLTSVVKPSASATITQPTVSQPAGRTPASDAAREEALATRQELASAKQHNRRDGALSRPTVEVDAKISGLEAKLEDAESKYDWRDYDIGIAQRAALGAKSIAQTLNATPGVVAQTAKQAVSDLVQTEKNKAEVVDTPERQAALDRMSQITGQLGYIERYKYPTRAKARESEEWKSLNAELEQLREQVESYNVSTPLDMSTPAMQKMTQAYQTQQDALTGLTGGKRWLGEQAISIGQNVALLPTAAVNPAIPAVAMGAVAAAGKMYEVGAEGGASGEALARGLVSGAIEVATEKIPVDNLLKLVKGTGKDAIGSAAKVFVAELFKQGAIEATEEAVSYTANYLADKAAGDPNATFSVAELLEAAAAGGFSGMVLGGFGSTVNASRVYAEDVLVGKAAKSSLIDYLDVAKNLPENTAAHKTADKIDATLRSKKDVNKVSDAQAGRLIRQIDIATKKASAAVTESSEVGEDSAPAAPVSEVGENIATDAEAPTETVAPKSDLDRALELVDDIIGTIDGIRAARTGDTQVAQTAQSTRAEDSALEQPVASERNVTETPAAPDSSEQVAGPVVSQGEPVTPAENVTEQSGRIAPNPASAETAPAAPSTGDVPDGANVRLTTGKEVDGHTFVARYLESHPGQTHDDAVRVLTEARRANEHRQLVPEALLQPAAETPAPQAAGGAGRRRSARGDKRYSADAERADVVSGGNTEVGAEVDPKAGNTYVQVMTEELINAALPDGAARVSIEAIDSPEEGYYDNDENVIVLNANVLKSQRAIMYYLGHELVHNGDYNDNRAVTDAIKQLGTNLCSADDWQRLIDDKRTNYYEFYTKVKGKTHTEAQFLTRDERMEEEVCADIMRYVFDSTDVLSRFAQTNPTGLQRVVRAVARFRDNVVGHIAGVGDALVSDGGVSAETESLLAKLEAALAKGPVPRTSDVDTTPRSSIPRIASTETEEFKAWFHDDSGELTNPDGTPKVFLRGDARSGATVLLNNVKKDNGGIFFSTDLDTAAWYATTELYTGPESAREYKPFDLSNWEEAELMVLHGLLGPNVRLEYADRKWELSAKNRGGKWEVLGTYPNTKRGLAKYNAEYGNKLSAVGNVNPGYLRVYLSAENTLVIDAKGRKWTNVDGNHTSTDEAVENAWAAGYDCVVIKNVQDGAPTDMEFEDIDGMEVYKAASKAIDVTIVRDGSQVKSVYNTGAFDRANPDIRYSVDSSTPNPYGPRIPFAEQVDMLLDGTFNEEFKGAGYHRSVLYVAAEPSALLQQIGLSDLPMIITQSHMRQMVGKRWGEDGKILDPHNHELSPEQAKSLPEKLRDPLMIIKSDPNGKSAGGVVLVTDMRDKKGDPVIVTISPDRIDYVYDGVTGSAHFVNMYGRARFGQYLAAVTENDQILYVKDGFNPGSLLEQGKEKEPTSPRFSPQQNRWRHQTSEESSNGPASYSLAPQIRRHERTYETGSGTIVAEKDPTVKPGERRFSVDGKPLADPLYSQMEQVLNAYKGEKIGAPSLVSYLKNHGVKAEEIKWSGIEQFLEGKKSVTKDELFEFLAANELVIEDVVLSDDVTSGLTPDEQTELDELSARVETAGHTVGRMAEDLGLEDVADEYHATFMRHEGDEPFQQWFFGRAQSSIIRGMTVGMGDAEVVPDTTQLRNMAIRNDNFGFDYSNQAVEAIRRDPGAFAHEYDMDATDRAILLDYAEKKARNEVARKAWEAEHLAEFQEILKACMEGEEAAKGRDHLVQVSYNRVAATRPRYANYALRGGTEGNYREILFRLPSLGDNLESPHWKQNDVMAHTRVQDIVDAEGKKVLFVDEVQSDWHQAGRDRGYRPSLSDVELVDNGWHYAIKVKGTPFGNILTKERLGELFDSDNYTVSYMDHSSKEAFAKEFLFHQYSVRDYDRVPDAPYKDTWHEYVLKRILRMAAEGGYDKVAWTTGKMQADRYHLSHQLRRIEVAGSLDDEVQVTPFYDYTIHYRDGQTRRNFYVDPDEMVETFGHDLGKRLMTAADENPGGIADVEGDDLEIGGEGMKNFYDVGGKSSQNIPKFLNKYLKPWGVTVKSSLVGKNLTNTPAYKKGGIDEVMRVRQLESTIYDDAIDRTYLVPSVEVTEQMRDDLLYKGQPRYSVSGNRGGSNVTAQEYAQISSARMSKYARLATEDIPSVDRIYAHDAVYIVANSGLDKFTIMDRIDPRYIQSRVTEIEEEVFRYGDNREGNRNGALATEKQPNSGRTAQPAGGDIALRRGRSDNRMAGGADRGAYGQGDIREGSGDGGPAPLTDDITYSPDYAYWRNSMLDDDARRYSAPDKRRDVRTGGNTGNVNPETGFERHTVADELMQRLDFNNPQELTDAFESAVQRIAEFITNEDTARADQRRADLTRQVLRPKVTPERAEQNRQTADELIRRYGEMPQTSVAQQEVHLPTQIDRDTRVAGAAQTLQAASVTNDVVRDEMTEDILSGTAGLTYQRIGDKQTLDRVDEEFKNKGFETMLRDWRSAVDTKYGSFVDRVGKMDIARAEKLYVEACANKDVATAIELAAEISAVATQAGQTVQAMTLLRKMTPSGQFYYIQKAVDRINNDPKTKQTIKLNDELVANLLMATTREEIDAAMDALLNSIAAQTPVSLADKWNTWRYFAMLGNARTHIRNLFGNAVFVPARLMKDAIGVALERTLPQEQRTKSLTASQELRDFAKQDAEYMRSTLSGGGKYNPADMIRDRRTIYPRMPWLNMLVEGNSAALEFEDWLFLRRAYERALAGFLSARGADVATLTGADSTPEGRKMLAEARAYATLEAQKATYRDASALASALNYFKNQNALSKVVLGGVMPFTKTPINIAKRGVEYSPLGLVPTVIKVIRDTTYAYNESLRKNQPISFGKALSDAIFNSGTLDGLSSAAAGTILVAFGWFAARLGLLTGALGDDEEDEFAKLQGEQAYAINAGDASFTVDWAAPTVLPLFIGVELYNALTDDYDDTTLLTAIVDGATSILEPMMSMTMLEGVNDALSANKYGDSEDAIYSVLSTAASSYAAQGVPTILGQIARTIDPDRRTSFVEKGTGKTESSIQYFVQSNLQGKIPFVSQGKMRYIDNWGRVDTTQNIALRLIENMLSPGYISTKNTSPVDEEIARLAEATKDTSVMPSRAQKYFSVNKQSYNMTQEEYEAHLIDRGQTSLRMVSELVNDPRYAQMSDEERVKAINYIYDYADDTAKYHTTSDYKRNDWMEKLDSFVDAGGNAADYISMMTEAYFGGSSVSVSDVAATRDDIPIAPLCELLAAESSSSQRTPVKFNDPYIDGYEYVMTDDQQKRYSDTFDRIFSERFRELVEYDEWAHGSAGERESLLSDLRKEVTKETKVEMSDWLFDHDIYSTEKS